MNSSKREIRKVAMILNAKHVEEREEQKIGKGIPPLSKSIRLLMHLDGEPVALRR